LIEEDGNGTTLRRENRLYRYSQIEAQYLLSQSNWVKKSQALTVQNPSPGNAPQATRIGVGEALAREFIFIAIRKSCHITSASGMRDFSCLGRVRFFFLDHLAVG
jgi:hypothetical protein